MTPISRGSNAGDGSPIPLLVDHIFRRESAKMVSGLSRVFGLENLDLVEDVVQDALVQALRSWPFSGIPENPGAWLTQVARNRAKDLLRRRSVFRRKAAELAPTDEAVPESAVDRLDLDDPLGDETLAMIFACCHPSLAMDSRVALTLKTVCGFGVSEIARAFLANEPAVAQRLVRAKSQLRDQGVSLEIPALAELPRHLDAVLSVIYLLFNEGYAAHRGDDLIRRDLCDEAIRLGRLVASRDATATPAAHALLALMLFHASRLTARVDVEGDLVLLSDQDRAKWDVSLIHEAMFHVERCSEGDQLSEYHLQAGIAVIHAVAPDDASTDWSRLVELYDLLLDIRPSPISALNRAVALARVQGPRAGLDAIDDLARDGDLDTYYLLHATRADLQARMGNQTEAASSYRRALDCDCSEPERRFLRTRLERLAEGAATSLVDAGKRQGLR